MSKSRITRAERATGSLSHVAPEDWYPFRSGEDRRIVLRRARTVSEAKAFQEHQWECVTTEEAAIQLLLTGSYCIDMTTAGITQRSILTPKSIYIDHKPLDVARAEFARAECLRRLAEVLARPQQEAFRRSLRDRYGDRCQISGCPVMAVVQAAHVVRLADGGSDLDTNGILLRSDIHILFDLDLICIDTDPTAPRVHVHPELANTEYMGLDGLPLRVPGNAERRPDQEGLRVRWEAFTRAQA